MSSEFRAFIAASLDLIANQSPTCTVIIRAKQYLFCPHDDCENHCMLHAIAATGWIIKNNIIIPTSHMLYCCERHYRGQEMPLCIWTIARVLMIQITVVIISSNNVFIMPCVPDKEESSLSMDWLKQPLGIWSPRRILVVDMPIIMITCNNTPAMFDIDNLVACECC